MTSAQEQEFFRQRGFGLRIGFGKRPALLVIDMIKAFTDPSMMLGADLDAQIEATRQLLQAARDTSIPVIFSTVAYDEPQQKDAGIWALKQRGTATLVAGSDGVRVDQRLGFRAPDMLLVKKYASCFFGTDLVPRLLAHEVDTLVWPAAPPADASGPPPSMPARPGFGRWLCARPLATARPRRMRRACLIWMPSTRMWSRSRKRCATCANLALFSAPTALEPCLSPPHTYPIRTQPP